MPSAIEVTMFLPASLNLPKKFLTVLNAPVIPFLTAFLTLLNALVTIPLRPLKIEVKTALMVFNTPFIMLCQAFVMLDIIFIIPDSKLDTVLLIVSQAPRQSPVIICITALIIPFIRLIAVPLIALITFHTDSTMIFILSQAAFTMGTIISNAVIIISLILYQTPSSPSIINSLFSFHHSISPPQISMTKSETTCIMVDIVSFIVSQTPITRSLNSSLDLYNPTNNATSAVIAPITIHTGADIAPIAPPRIVAPAFIIPNHLLTAMTAVINLPNIIKTGPMAMATIPPNNAIFLMVS